MALRATVNDVEALVEVQSDPPISVLPFLNEASVVVDDIVACAARKNVTHSAAKLRLIEARLAAHFYSLRDELAASRNTGKAGGTFKGQTGMGLDFTQHGQTAKMLDTSGCLASFDKGARAGASWLGKRKSKQIAYAQRD